MKAKLFAAAALMISTPLFAATLELTAQGEGTAPLALGLEGMIKKAEPEAELNCDNAAKSLCEGGKTTIQGDYSYEATVKDDHLVLIAKASYLCNPG